LLRIQDTSGKTKFIWRDEDEEPVSIDELILEDQQREKEKKEKQDAAKKPAE
jgi:hypothetical protein